MKLVNRISATFCLIIASGAVWGHPGHEAIGDALHIEYLLVAGTAVAVAVYAVIRHKRDGQD